MRIFAIIYIALGILYHLVSSFGFSWSDPWLYVHIGLWPLFVLFWGALFFGLCYVGYILYDKVDSYRRLTPKQKMQRKRIAEQRKAHRPTNPPTSR